MFEKIFINIFKQAIKYNLVDESILCIDSTRKKANANNNKYEDAVIEVVKKEGNG